mgnify:CR=1 FL=1
MWTLATIFLGSLMLWFMWEVWRAPHYQENMDGTHTQTTRTKTFKDLVNSVKNLFSFKCLK